MQSKMPGPARRWLKLNCQECKDQTFRSTDGGHDLWKMKINLKSLLSTMIKNFVRSPKDF